MNRIVYVTMSICGILVILGAIFYLNSANVEPNVDTVKFVAILHRHGDRSPRETYPNDPHRNYSWSGGLGALTMKGSLQMFTMGKYLRSRYKQLLPPDGRYSHQNMRVFSSHTERCVMSSESLLAAFMKPDASENLLPIEWQPVPLVVLPADRDNMLAIDHVPCPKYDAIYRKLLTNPDPHTEFYEFNKKLTDLYRYLTEHTGQNVTNVDQVARLTDIFFVESNNNLTLPAWTHSVYPHVLNSVFQRGRRLRAESAYMTRIRGGPILVDIFDQLVQKQQGELSRNIAFYSGHDTTIYFLASALNVVDQTAIQADYAATVVIELHCAPQMECHVNILYYFNSSNSKPKPLVIPDCPAPCSLSRFETVTAANLLRDFQKECELPN